MWIKRPFLQLKITQGLDRLRGRIRYDASDDRRSFGMGRDRQPSLELLLTTIQTPPAYATTPPHRRCRMQVFAVPQGLSEVSNGPEFRRRQGGLKLYFSTSSTSCHFLQAKSAILLFLSRLPIRQDGERRGFLDLRRGSEESKYR